MKRYVVSLLLLAAGLPTAMQGQDSLNTGGEFPLPLSRLLGAPPRVAGTGTIRSVNGSAAVPLTATFAAADLKLYRHQLAALFPDGVERYPTDSLRALKAARAAAWLERLHVVRTSSAVSDRERIALAEVAMVAGQDTLAKRLYDELLASIPKRANVAASRRNAVRASVILAAAITAFTNPDQGVAGVTRNVPVAEAYMRRLDALPYDRYATLTDSFDVLYRRIAALQAAAMAADYRQAPADVVRHVHGLMTVANQLAFAGRRDVLVYQFPYRELATALASAPGASSAGVKARLDSLHAQIRAQLALRASDTPVGTDSVRRVQLQREAPSAMRIVDQKFAAIGLVGAPAPDIVAHAWLNSGDSLYAAPPRQRSPRAGRVRVIGFGNMESGLLPAFDRLHRQMSDVDVVFVTETEGHIGPDLATPGEEVAWLNRYYRGKRGLSVPIAVWAGDKVSGEYGALRPTPSPVPSAYYANAFGLTICVVIDSRGIVRAFHQLRTREDEARLQQRLSVLLAESKPSPTATLPNVSHAR